MASRMEIFEVLFLLESIHAGPEPFVRISDQLFLLDKTMKGLLDQIFAFLDVVKNFAPKGEEAAVD